MAMMTHKRFVSILSPEVGERGIFHRAYIAIAGVIDKHIPCAKKVLNCLHR